MEMFNKTNASVDGDGNIVIQNSDNSSITININRPEEVQKILLDLQNKITELPLNIVKLLMEKNQKEVPISGANVYFSVNILFETYGGQFSGRISGIAIGVTVTNTNREHRYFFEPSFKTSVPIEGDWDTFMMTNPLPNNPKFPKRLEYGEQFSVNYNIPNPGIFKTLFEKDKNATLVAFANTTLGEVFFSNEYQIAKLLENEKYMRANPMDML